MKLKDKKMIDLYGTNCLNEFDAYVIKKFNY